MVKNSFLDSSSQNWLRSPIFVAVTKSFFSVLFNNTEKKNFVTGTKIGDLNQFWDDGSRNEFLTFVLSTNYFSLTRLFYYT